MNSDTTTTASMIADVAAKAAILAYESLVSRFPSSPWTDEAKQRIQALRSVTAGGEGE